MIVLGFALHFIGFIALSLAMKRHYLQWWPAQRQYSKKRFRWRSTLLRIVGYSALAAGCLLCLVSEGVAIGLILWMGLLTVAALTQTVMLAYWPRRVLHLGLMVLAVGVVTGVTDVTGVTT